MALAIESAVGADIDWNVTLLGHATVVDDGERLDWARGWIYDASEDDPSTAADSDPEFGTAGGEESDGGSTLVEVAVSSAAWNVYD